MKKRKVIFFIVCIFLLLFSLSGCNVTREGKAKQIYKEMVKKYPNYDLEFINYGKGTFDVSIRATNKTTLDEFMFQADVDYDDLENRELWLQYDKELEQLLPNTYVSYTASSIRVLNVVTEQEISCEELNDAINQSSLSQQSHMFVDLYTTNDKEIFKSYDKEHIRHYDDSPYSNDGLYNKKQQFDYKDKKLVSIDE